MWFLLFTVVFGIAAGLGLGAWVMQGTDDAPDLWRNSR